MPKQRSVREVLKRLRQEGFSPSPTQAGKGSHQVWKHPDGRYAIISVHNSGQMIPIGTLKSIEKTSGVEF